MEMLVRAASGGAPPLLSHRRTRHAAEGLLRRAESIVSSGEEFSVPESGCGATGFDCSLWMARRIAGARARRRGAISRGWKQRSADDRSRHSRPLVAAEKLEQALGPAARDCPDRTD